MFFLEVSISPMLFWTSPLSQKRRDAHSTKVSTIISLEVFKNLKYLVLPLCISELYRFGSNSHHLFQVSWQTLCSVPAGGCSEIFPSCIWLSSSSMCPFLPTLLGPCSDNPLHVFLFLFRLFSTSR